ncbi:MAG: hypothetical protein K2N37_05385, partial [Lachnospiraceae bacterium]|nr:hypothetical protein [Lachnospiraceae bacterium]
MLAWMDASEDLRRATRTRDAKHLESAYAEKGRKQTSISNLLIPFTQNLLGENGKEENMGFQTFVDNIVDLLQERMGDAYEIKVIRVTKNNDVELTGIAITRQEDSIFPTIYLE